jgi:hypothetical protein
MLIVAYITPSRLIPGKTLPVSAPPYPLNNLQIFQFRKQWLRYQWIIMQEHPLFGVLYFRILQGNCLLQTLFIDRCTVGNKLVVYVMPSAFKTSNIICCQDCPWWCDGTQKLLTKALFLPYPLRHTVFPTIIFEIAGKVFSKKSTLPLKKVPCVALSPLAYQVH